MLRICSHFFHRTPASDRSDEGRFAGSREIFLPIAYCTAENRPLDVP